MRAEAAHDDGGSGVLRIAGSRQVDDSPNGILRVKPIAAPDFDVAQHHLQAGLVVEAGRARLAVLGLERMKQLALVRRQLLLDHRELVQQAVHVDKVDELRRSRLRLVNRPYYSPNVAVGIGRPPITLSGFSWVYAWLPDWASRSLLHFPKHSTTTVRPTHYPERFKHHKLQQPAAPAGAPRLRCATKS